MGGYKSNLKDVRKQVTPSMILDRVSEIEIFERFLGINVQFDRQFTSPIRKDSSAGCKFWYNTSGKIKYIDKAKGINEDCFGVIPFIPMYEGYNFDQVLQTIAKEFGIINNEGYETLKPTSFLTRGGQDIVIKKKIIHSVPIKKWHQVHIHFWKSYFVTGQVIKDLFIYPLGHGLVNHKNIYTHKKEDIGFVYYFPDDSQKLYFPNRKKGEKFITDSKYLQGYHCLPKCGEILIITKSMKDVAVLRSLGIPAVAPQGESSWMSEDILNDLRLRFKTIYILFDNDETGIRFSNKRVEENSDIIPIFVPDNLGNDEKDIADVALWCNTIEETGEILNYMINE
jgi:5S rRNA maturation endonuclease (ribonuclease M5)